MTKQQILVTAQQSGNDVRLKLSVKDASGGYVVASEFEEFTLHDCRWPSRKAIILEMTDWDEELKTIFLEMRLGESTVDQLIERARRSLEEWQNTPPTVVKL
jgi:hypothetical protein